MVWLAADAESSDLSVFGYEFIGPNKPFVDISKIFKKYTVKAAMYEQRMHDLCVVEKVEKLFWDPV